MVLGSADSPSAIAKVSFAASNVSWWVEAAPVAQLITWMLVVGGWLYTHRRSLARDRRKEDFERIKDLTQRIEKLERLAVEHLASAPSDADKKKAADLRQQLHAISRILDGMRRRNARFDVSKETIQLRHAVTGGDYDSSSRSAARHDSETILNIRFACQDLTDALGDRLDQAHST